ncbi:tenascin isoform X1 [Rhagoletis pomonella]|uniref:tenascin isoform X1 n=1 Tax=Rhagoletis pomonella TaxID=28610 RepID=UPI00177BF938|nr:tenascin isoform X1 [Rhagoletis pomonella]XP_036321233.1 tenascin isoform X1 [Rhagoletis pomonella]
MPLLPACTFASLTLTAITYIAAQDQNAEQLFGDIYYEIGSFSLRYNDPNGRGNKCQREVPARYFQTSPAAPIRGNGSTIHWQRIEVCCEGYMRSRFDRDQCIPDCSGVSPNNCRNGHCHAPNQCVCFAEFVRNDRGECVHTCPIACEHGRCYLNGTCQCDPGYTLDLETRKFCRAQCSQGCGTHQQCVAPGKCACTAGYKMTTDLGCQPVCIPDCGHGKCVGPNKCECFKGYIKRPLRNVCEAECYISCENGFCESRNNCQCRNGYKYDMDTTSCLPDCGENCRDGICVGPGICKCFEGYEYSEANCEPICDRDCGYHGSCMEPGACGCKLTKQLCISGLCDRSGRCICPIRMSHFIDRCVEAAQLNEMMTGYEQREHFSRQLRREFEILIGSKFQFMQQGK